MCANTFLYNMGYGIGNCLQTGPLAEKKGTAGIWGLDFVLSFLGYWSLLKDTLDMECKQENYRYSSVVQYATC